VVIAAGSWSSLVEGVGLPPATVKPVRGQIVLVETRPPAVRGTVVTPGGYVVGRADGRVLCGSTMEQAGYDKSVTAGGLAKVLGMALATVPALAAAPVLETWANFRPTTADHLPILGESAIAGLVFATGHFRNGILLSPITAEIISDVVRGVKTTAFDAAAFSPARLSSSN
jgi:glycine oxidase